MAQADICVTHSILETKLILCSDQEEKVQHQKTQTQK